MLLFILVCVRDRLDWMPEKSCSLLLLRTESFSKGRRHGGEFFQRTAPRRRVFRYKGEVVGEQCFGSPSREERLENANSESAAFIDGESVIICRRESKKHPNPYPRRDVHRRVYVLPLN